MSLFGLAGFRRFLVKRAGTAVETTGKVTEAGADAVKGGGNIIKKIGEKIKGDKKE
jgi:hypothetical protein